MPLRSPALDDLRPAAHTARASRFASLRWMPARRDVNFALNLTLPTLLIVSFISGWMASMMGLTEFGLHKYSSIAAFVTAGGHLVLHRRSLMGQIRHRRNGGRETLAPRPELRLLSQAVNVAATPAAANELRPTGT